MKVKMKILAALLVFSFPSISAFADENQNLVQQQQLTQQEQDQINQQISQDKQKFQAAQAVNAKRMQVIKSCSQYLDDSLSPQSVAKVKECLSQNNGYFPEEDQIPADQTNAQMSSNVSTNMQPQVQQQPVQQPDQAPVVRNDSQGQSSSGSGSSGSSLSDMFSAASQ